MIQGHSRSNSIYFFSRILVTLTSQKYAHVVGYLQQIVQKVSSEFEFYVCSACVMMNWKETPPSNCKVRTVVPFLTKKIIPEPKFIVVYVLPIVKRIRVFPRAFLLTARRRFYQQHSCKQINAVACTCCVLLAACLKFPTFARACTSELAACRLDGVHYILWFDY